ncbi:MAG: amidase [Tissierellia bacterium]|nr:amidase [Tissierellia bacterium]
MEKFLELDLKKYWQLQEEGKLSSRELCGWYLQRIARYDGYYRTILEINPDALFIAEAMDRELALGRKRSFLHGVPVLLKDNISTGDGLHTSAGSMALKNHFAKEDAFIVKLLREAGAVILGKTNMTELSHYTSNRMKNGYSARGGQVLHPYHEMSSPSGSSTGSAVGLALNFSLLAIGTETKGSIIWPSHNSSIVGIKPSRGLISRSGIIPICRAHDTAGPMARTVTDCAYLLSVLSEEDPKDPSTWALENNRWNYARFLRSGALDGMRLGIKNTDFGGEEEELFNEAIGVMKDLGAQFKGPYNLPEVGKEDLVILSHEFKRSIEQYLHEYDAPIKLLEEIIDYNQENTDLLYGQDLLEKAFEIGDTLSDPSYLNRRVSLAQETRKRIENLMDEEDLDLLVFPGRSNLPSVSGLPCIIVPCGYKADNKPLGICFIARNFDEGRMIAAAYSYEQASLKRKPPQIKEKL